MINSAPWIFDLIKLNIPKVTDPIKYFADTKHSYLLINTNLYHRDLIDNTIRLMSDSVVDFRVFRDMFVSINTNDRVYINYTNYLVIGEPVKQIVLNKRGKLFALTKSGKLFSCSISTGIIEQLFVDIKQIEMDDKVVFILSESGDLCTYECSDEIYERVKNVCRISMSENHVFYWTDNNKLFLFDKFKSVMLLDKLPSEGYVRIQTDTINFYVGTDSVVVLHDLIPDSLLSQISLLGSRFIIDKNNVMYRISKGNIIVVESDVGRFQVCGNDVIIFTSDGKVSVMNQDCKFVC